MKLSLRNLFAKTRVHSSKERYYVVSLSGSSSVGDLFSRLRPFASITFEKDEISIVLKEEEWKKQMRFYETAKVGGPYRLITFNVLLDLSVCGYFAVISKLLAKAGISILPMSTYLRDYLLVRDADNRKALATINRFLKNQRTRNTKQPS